MRSFLCLVKSSQIKSSRNRMLREVVVSTFNSAMSKVAGPLGR